MKGKTILVWVLGVTASIAVLFLVVYGGYTDNPALYTPGVGIITSVISAFVTYYFDSDRRDKNEH